MEVYVDDMLVKSIKASEHITNLGETSILQEYRMKLNPAKCAFGVGSSKFLNFKSAREQLKGHKKAKWTSECDQAFQQLKQYLGSPPLLSELKEDVGTEAILVTPSALPLLKDTELDKGKSRWTLFVDGSSNSKRAGAGIILVALDSTTIQYAIRLGFKASNNEVEYEGLLAGLRLTASLGVKLLEVRCDSQLAMNYISTENEAKETRMVAYLAEAKKLIERFGSYTINQIPRMENSWADALTKLASATEGMIPRIIPMEFLDSPSIDRANQEMVNPVEATPSWMDPIFEYLTIGQVPQDRLEARCLKIRAARYIILDGTLYKKGHSQPYLRYLRPDEPDYVIQEIHERIYENQSNS
ncbi:uncharacterized protein LOC131234607 [Magnolia sinica]|uniref:uncharacterized protein LOC131234607 n=1 Tax=Magnolia sinica TaxID=86752 RepID=UPI002658CD77|nr:uncharacterized protein LOC131234607 [Magnolia sinica]